MSSLQLDRRSWFRAVVGAGALWLSERSGMGMTGAMEGTSAPMEHQMPGESSGVDGPEQTLLRSEHPV